MDDEPSEPLVRIASHAQQVASIIFVADRAVSIVQATGEGVDGINAANLGELFGALRDALIDDALLAVAKIFERATPRYPLWSLPSLLREIEDSLDGLPLLDRPRALQYVLADPSCTSISKESCDRELCLAMLGLMRSRLPDAASTEPRPHDIALEALRQQRDKVIAHNEAMDRGGLLSASWQDLDGLLGLAKGQLGLIGWTFLNTVYVADDGDYLLTDDAARSGMAMRRLLVKAQLRPPSHRIEAV